MKDFDKIMSEMDKLKAAFDSNEITDSDYLERLANYLQEGLDAYQEEKEKRKNNKITAICIKPSELPKPITISEDDLLSITRLVNVDKEGNLCTEIEKFEIIEIKDGINIISSPKALERELPLVRKIGTRYKFYGVMYIVKIDSSLNFVSMTSDEITDYCLKFSSDEIQMRDLELGECNDRISYKSGGAMIFGGINIINKCDIVEIEEKIVTINVRKSKKNPAPKPTGFFSKLTYSERIYYDEVKKFSCVILKVKGGTQIIGEVDERGNFSGYNNQLYDFYTIYNDENLIRAVGDNQDKLCEIGNFYAYPGILKYDDYIGTNMLFDSSIKTKEDFIKKYL